MTCGRSMTVVRAAKVSRRYSLCWSNISWLSSRLREKAATPAYWKMRSGWYQFCTVRNMSVPMSSHSSSSGNCSCSSSTVSAV